MKKILICLIIVFMFSMPVLAEEEFGNFEWDMSKEGVIEEKGEDYKEIDSGRENVEIISYMTNIWDKKYEVRYAFKNNKLFGAGYEYKEEHEFGEMDKYDDMYDSIKEHITDKYGEPKEEEIHWFNKEDFKEDKSDIYAGAIAVGRGAKEIEWEVDGVEITMYLSQKGDFKDKEWGCVELSVHYSYYRDDKE